MASFAEEVSGFLTIGERADAALADANAATLEASRDLGEAATALSAAQGTIVQLGDQVAQRDLEIARLKTQLAAGAPPAPAASRRLELGMNEHPAWGDYDEAILAKWQAAGVKRLRADVGWSDLQPNPGAFGGTSAIAKLDRFVDQCSTRGIKPLLMIYKPPFWSSGSGSASNPSKAGIPADPADFGRVVAWLVDRYGAKLAGVEMLNEFNIATFGNKDPATYVRLLKAGYAAAKGRGVPLIAGAATYLGLDGSWLASCYAQGLAGGVTHDKLGIHPYLSPSNVGPLGNTTGSARKWSIVGISDVRALQATNADPSGLIATEFGWSAHDNAGIDPAATPWKLGVSEAQQAAYLEQAYGALALAGVEAAYWYCGKDTKVGDLHEDGFGVLRRDLTAKPAYASLSTLARL